MDQGGCRIQRVHLPVGFLLFILVKRDKFQTKYSKLDLILVNEGKFTQIKFENYVLNINN